MQIDSDVEQISASSSEVELRFDSFDHASSLPSSNEEPMDSAENVYSFRLSRRR